MDKAESRALEAYPKEGRNAFHSYFGILEFDGNAAHRVGYINGYRRAEKDLALTWEDIAKIITIYELEVAEGNISRYGEAKDLQPYSKRILEKFNKLKTMI